MEDNLPQSFSSLRSSQSKMPSQKLVEGTHCPDLHRRPTHSFSVQKNKEKCINDIKKKIYTIFINNTVAG